VSAPESERRPHGDRGAAGVGEQKSNLPEPAAQPVERHTIPDDKVIWFELPAIRRLVGIWQGPGCIAQLRLARRRP
jgi:hypothetical protein